LLLAAFAFVTRKNHPAGTLDTAGAPFEPPGTARATLGWLVQYHALQVRNPYEGFVQVVVNFTGAEIPSTSI